MKSVVALGNFDGVHRGHHHLLKAAVAVGIKEKLTCIAWTFEKHPKNVLAGECITKQIMTNDMKYELIRYIGVDKVVFADFEKVKDLSCEEFVDKVLVQELSAAHVFCGENYTFGKKAAGDAKKLRQLCESRGIKVTIIPILQSSGTDVCSTRIRTLIEQGKVEQANLLLLQRFFIRGEVLKGNKIGSKYNMPTVNMVIPHDIVKPKSGVYFSKTVADGESYISLTNIGTRPTVGGTEENMETHIIGYHGNLYGKIIDVHLLKYHRGEKKFDSLDELFRQIEKDIEDRKKWNG